MEKKKTYELELTDHQFKALVTAVTASVARAQNTGEIELALAFAIVLAEIRISQEKVQGP